jgi:hypothetical protein
LQPSTVPSFGRSTKQCTDKLAQVYREGYEDAKPKCQYSDAPKRERGDDGSYYQSGSKYQLRYVLQATQGLAKRAKRTKDDDDDGRVSRIIRQRVELIANAPERLRLKIVQ